METLKESLEESLKDPLEKSLYPLYEDMVKNNKYEKTSLFCMQWGKYFPEKNGLLFVGKAANGWVKIKDINDVKDAFNTVFARTDQMEWVKNLEGKKMNHHEGDDDYNTKQSAFWRVVKNISKKYTKKDDWYSYVAWSNLYKISPETGGNPNMALRKKQLPDCREILKKEIEILKPKYVILFTSGWEKDFLWYLQNGQTSHLKKITWAGKYEAKLYKIKDVTYITSVHPQGKPEEEHIKTIMSLMGC